jgi:hypothetical protein
LQPLEVEGVPFLQARSGPVSAPDSCAMRSLRVSSWASAVVTAQRLADVAYVVGHRSERAEEQVLPRGPHAGEDTVHGRHLGRCDRHCHRVTFGFAAGSESWELLVFFVLGVLENSFVEVCKH